MDASTKPLPAILDLLREDRLIEAIKIFRTTYGGGLREAKDAVETIRDACAPRDNMPAEYVVLSRDEDDVIFQVTRTDSKEHAMKIADGLVDYRAEVMVANVIACSVITRHMKEVA
jgi:hypothetical protein